MVGGRLNKRMSFLYDLLLSCMCSLVDLRISWFPSLIIPSS
jgi:hypothetical protein